MLFVKHAICSTAGLFGGVFGYVCAETDAWTLTGAMIGMFSLRASARLRSRSL